MPTRSSNYVYTNVAISIAVDDDINTILAIDGINISFIDEFVEDTVARALPFRHNSTTFSLYI